MTLLHVKFQSLYLQAYNYSLNDMCLLFLERRRSLCQSLSGSTQDWVIGSRPESRELVN